MMIELKALTVPLHRHRITVTNLNAQTVCMGTAKNLLKVKQLRKYTQVKI